MAGVIAYDKPVTDFIDGLNATGHVTNTAYRKTSVTFHHNGGRLSLQGVLDVWKTRPASAQFDVDGQGRVGQYVKVNEYAWATGNTQGNKESISIELANATLAPNWIVADVTWKEGARLCGWLHARVLGVRPSRETVRVHHDWKSTLCAGPYIDSILAQIISESQSAYDFFVAAVATPAPAPAPAAPAPSAPARRTNEELAREVIAGAWGNGPERSRRLSAAGYSPTEVQAAVNAQLGTTGPARATRLSVETIADQVIRGQWGNGTERMRRISAAGYDYNAVRAAVNAKLGG